MRSYVHFLKIVMCLFQYFLCVSKNCFPLEYLEEQVTLFHDKRLGAQHGRSAFSHLITLTIIMIRLVSWIKSLEVKYIATDLSVIQDTVKRMYAEGGPSSYSAVTKSHHRWFP